MQWLAIVMQTENTIAPFFNSQKLLLIISPCFVKRFFPGLVTLGCLTIVLWQERLANWFSLQETNTKASGWTKLCSVVKLMKHIIACWSALKTKTDRKLFFASASQDWSFLSSESSMIDIVDLGSIVIRNGFNEYLRFHGINTLIFAFLTVSSRQSEIFKWLWFQLRKYVFIWQRNRFLQ